MRNEQASSEPQVELAAVHLIHGSEPTDPGGRVTAIQQHVDAVLDRLRNKAAGATTSIPSQTGHTAPATQRRPPEEEQRIPPM